MPTYTEGNVQFSAFMIVRFQLSTLLPYIYYFLILQINIQRGIVKLSAIWDIFFGPLPFPHPPRPAKAPPFSVD